jgi:predicted pyridoxine 5'-phosphate oxidase superfamily flavin-nucleotide-binding protein
MARQRAHQLITIDTATIIVDPNQPGTTRIDFDGNRPGTRIETVFNQLFYD